MNTTANKWLAVLTLTLSCAAQAFEGKEHEAVSNLAMRFLLAHPDLAVGGSYKFTPDDLAAMRTLTDERYGLTYGDITRCVDHFLVPEKMLAAGARTDNRLWYPGKRSDLFLSRATNCSAGYGTKTAGIGATIAASHNNHTHFQDDLLVALNMHHTVAVSIAASRPENGSNPQALYGALVVNAISDHYLQDFFAPGHMVTARAGLTDTFSNSIHDKANQDGAYYELDAKTLDWIASIGERLYGARIPQASRDDAAQLRKELCEMDAPGKPVDAAACEQRIGAALQRIQAERTVFLKGDDRLQRKDGMEQRLLMMAVNVRSIADVLQAYAQRTPSNSFGNIVWRYNEEDLGQALAAREGAAAATKPALLEAGFGHGAYVIPPEAEGHPAPPARQEGKYKFGDISPVLMFQVGRESMFNGDRFGRWAYSLSASTKCFNCFERSRIANIFVSGGLLYLKEDEFDATGIEARLHGVLPTTETAVVPYMRYVRYPEQGSRAWHSGWGLRVEQGFSSFVTVYLGMGSDYGPTNTKSLEHRRFFVAGVNFGAPWERLRMYLP